jgi:hypothetical protein
LNGFNLPRYWRYIEICHDDPLTKIYFASLGVLGVYIAYKIMAKNGLIPDK